MKKEILSVFKSLTLALLLVAGVSYAWTGPTAAPPDPNVDAPINVGASAQVKTGGFSAAGITTTNGNIFLRSQYVAGDNSSALYYDSNHDSITQMLFRDAQDTQYGRVYGSGDGANFGLLDGDGNWSYLAVKDNYTQIRVNNSSKLNVWSDGRVGAGQYCDINGGNCVSASALGGGSGAITVYQCPVTPRRTYGACPGSGCVGELSTNSTCTAVYSSSYNNVCRTDAGTVQYDAPRACTAIGRLVP